MRGWLPSIGSLNPIPREVARNMHGSIDRLAVEVLGAFLGAVAGSIVLTALGAATGAVRRRCGLEWASPSVRSSG